jgi:hypothetical protein
VVKETIMDQQDTIENLQNYIHSVWFYILG